MYMGRFVPKEGKNREKVTFYFVDTQKLILRLRKISVLDFSCMRVARAPSNSDVDFLLSQVSHLEGKWERKTIIFWKKEGAKSVFFSVVSSIFRG